ncbi:MAG: hypothetical protein ACJAUG_000966 [Halioglobus sp.]|jgi:uncharacterized protein YqiB (DUF1249 family)
MFKARRVKIRCDNLREPQLPTIRKKSYKLNLSELHAVCEGNYQRMLRLFPDYETCNSREFALGSSRVSFEVLERCRYTTFFRLHQRQSGDPLLGQLLIEVRAYHDARMLEVGIFQSHRSVDARYEYPNQAMYQQDEKSQQNRFLADWLEHCLLNGRIATAVICDNSDS